MCLRWSLEFVCVYRYRPAKAWMRQAEKYVEAASTKPYVAPGPGSLLIEKTVLVRRHEDGLYYKGKVMNQVNPWLIID